MNSGSSIFQVLYQGYYSQLLASSATTTQNVLAGTRIYMHVALTAAIVVVGWRMMVGAATFGDVSGRFARMIVVSTLFTGAYYSDWVVTLLTQELPDAISNSVAGQQGMGGARAFDGVDNAINAVGAQILQQTSALEYIPVQIAVFGIQFVAAIINGANFVIWLVARATLVLIASVAPFLLPLWLFDSLRDIAGRLLAKCIALLMVLALTQAISVITMSQVGELVKSAAGHPIASDGSLVNKQLTTNGDTLQFTGFDIAGMAGAPGAFTPAQQVGPTINPEASLVALRNIAVSLFVGFVLMLTSTVIAMGITGGSWTVTPALSMMTSGVSRGVSSAMQSTARRGR